MCDEVGSSKQNTFEQRQESAKTNKQNNRINEHFERESALSRGSRTLDHSCNLFQQQVRMDANKKSKR